MSTPSPSPPAAEEPSKRAPGVIWYQACQHCGAAQTLRRYACTRCGEERLEWRQSSGTGTVYAVTVVHRAPSEEFRALAPYALVLVTLDEGFRVMAHAATLVSIGDRVAAGFFQHGSAELIRFSLPNSSP